MHQGTNKQTVWPLVAQREVSSHQLISITEKRCPLRRPACLSMCGESRKCCSFPLLQLILSVQIITECMCVHVCMWMHHFGVEDCTEQLLKANAHSLGNGGQVTSFASTETSSHVLSLGILVRRKLPLTWHFCRYPLKTRFPCTLLCMIVCVYIHTWISLGHLLGESSVDLDAGRLAVRKALCSFVGSSRPPRLMFKHGGYRTI